MNHLAPVVEHEVPAHWQSHKVRCMVSLYTPEELPEYAYMSCEQIEGTLRDEVSGCCPDGGDQVDAELRQCLELHSGVLEELPNLRHQEYQTPEEASKVPSRTQGSNSL